MKIFIAIRIPRGSAELEALGSRVCEVILDAGHTPFLAYQEIIQRGLFSSSAFMPFVRQEIQRCKLAIIVYNPDLRGGLIEAGLAYAFEIPIWLLHKHGETVSSSMLGCSSKVIAFTDLDDLAKQLADAIGILDCPD
jgi:hypothetical protein